MRIGPARPLILAWLDRCLGKCRGCDSRIGDRREGDLCVRRTCELTTMGERSGTDEQTSCPQVAMTHRTHEEKPVEEKKKVGLPPSTPCIHFDPSTPDGGSRAELLFLLHGVVGLARHRGDTTLGWGHRREREMGADERSPEREANGWRI